MRVEDATKRIATNALNLLRSPGTSRPNTCSLKPRREAEPWAGRCLYAAPVDFFSAVTIRWFSRVNVPMSLPSVVGL